MFSNNPWNPNYSKGLKKNLAGKKLFGKKLEILYEALYKS